MSNSFLALPPALPGSWVAVFGAATLFTPGQVCAGYEIGRVLGRRSRGLMTGATTGVPYAAALGCREVNGRVIGISPADGPERHAGEYAKPLDGPELIVFTGTGFAARSDVIARSVGAAVFVGGEAGTLSEFTMCWMAGTPILGILERVGGISDMLREIAEQFETSWGSRLLFGESAVALADTVCDELERAELATSNAAGGPDPGASVRALLRRE